MKDTATVPNPDLEVLSGNKSRWTHSSHRRWGWHNLHRIARYGLSFRAASVMTLETRADLLLAENERVRILTSLPWFSAMVVIRGSDILFERYATDFHAAQPHSIQSISKTTINLMVGRLLEEGQLDLSQPMRDIVPEVGTGYADATLQEVLHMDVVNDYSEDFADPTSAYYRHEEAMGWRLPRGSAEPSEHGFIADIRGTDTQNHSGYAQYKDANTALLGWAVERASGKPLRSFLADIADAAGLEGALHITSDRTGVPTLEGGISLSARDLARYMSIFARHGFGVNGQHVGSARYLEQTLKSGVPMREPYEGLRYSNHLMVRDRTLGHGGWGGQYALVNLDTQTVGVYLSVLENEHATNLNFIRKRVAEAH